MELLSSFIYHMKLKKVLKTIYNYLPFKGTIFKVIRLIYSPHQNIYRHLHFKDVIKIKIAETSFKMQHYGFEIENEIFWKGIVGGWEKHSLKLWIHLSKKSRVIFDIVANTGVYALAAKTVNPEAEVFAFEPVKRVFEKLVHNINLNQFDIKVSENAISNKNGIATIYDQKNTEHTYSVTINKNMSGEYVEIVETLIPIVRLDKVINDQNITAIDLLKIDVETHELEVLEGMGTYVDKFRSYYLIEVLNSEIANGLNHIFLSKGYRYFNIDENCGIKEAFKIEVSDYCNYFLCPQEKCDEELLKLING